MKKALEAKIEEKALSDFKIELLYLPRYYAKRMKLNEEAKKLVYVSHRGLGEGVVPKLIPKDGEDVDKLKEAREKILALEGSGEPFVDTVLNALQVSALKTRLPSRESPSLR